MGIRETMNENPAITTGATAGLILIALVFILWSTFGGGGDAANGLADDAQVYYTVDDGATFVADDADKRYTDLKIDGKPATLVHVFSCDGKTRFAGYLERFSPEARKVLQAQEEAFKEGKPPQVFGTDAFVSSGHEVKRPKDAKWVRANTPEGAAVIAVKCPDGQDMAMEVAPE